MQFELCQSFHFVVDNAIEGFELTFLVAVNEAVFQHVFCYIAHVVLYNKSPSPHQCISTQTFDK